MAKTKEKWTLTEQAIIYLATAVMVAHSGMPFLISDIKSILRPKKIIKSKKK